MALVLRDCFIEVNDVDLSDHVNQVQVQMQKEDLDSTTFGKGQDRAHGLSDDSFQVQFLQSFEAGEVDATLFTVFDDELEFLVVVRPHADSKSATNPEYSGTCKLFEYQPLDGDVGQLSDTQVTFPVVGSISRATD